MFLRRRARIWLAALLAGLLFLFLALFVANNVQLEVRVSSGEATTEVALGEMSCRKTFSETFPFFKMTCAETAEAAP